MIKEPKRIVPDLRFPEFHGEKDWEGATLDSISKFRRGSFPQPYGLPKWYDNVNGTPFIQVFDVADDFLLKPKTKSKISALGAKQSVFVSKGTVIITIQGSIGRVAITQYDAYIDRTLLLFEKFLVEIDKPFFAYVLYLLFEIEKEKAPGGIIKTITKEVLSDFSINFPPSVKEQQKIASCLSSLDELIAANTQKLEALKDHKKGLMQQLFPAEGETVPRLRFPEFEGDGEWEEKKLEDVTTRGSGHTPKKSEPNYYNGGIKWVSLADSNKLDKGYIYDTRIEISKDGLKNSSAVLHPAGTVIVSRDAGVGKSAVLYSDMAVSQHFIVWRCDKQKTSNWFLYYFLQILKPKLESIATGSTIKTIGLPYFKDLLIPLPSIKEQEKVASCLSTLDSLITTQSEKIEALKTHKKGLMQGLFPTND